MKSLKVELSLSGAQAYTVVVGGKSVWRENRGKLFFEKSLTLYYWQVDDEKLLAKIRTLRIERCQKVLRMQKDELNIVFLVE